MSRPKDDLRPDDLEPLRAALLDVHAELLTYERHKYEVLHGRIKSPGEYFSLVMDDPSFQWLRELSSLIVAMDELTAGKDEPGFERIRHVVSHAALLLAPVEHGPEFGRNYHAALQASPAVLVAHGKAVQELNRLYEE